MDSKALLGMGVHAQADDTSPLSFLPCGLRTRLPNLWAVRV